MSDSKSPQTTQPPPFKVGDRVRTASGGGPYTISAIGPDGMLSVAEIERPIPVSAVAAQTPTEVLARGLWAAVNEPRQGYFRLAEGLIAALAENGYRIVPE